MDRPRRLTLKSSARALFAVAALVVAGRTGVADAQGRPPVTLTIDRVEGTLRAGDPIVVWVTLKTNQSTPVTIHFDHRLISFSLNPDTPAETLCEPPASAEEAQRREFITVSREHPHRARIALVRHCRAYSGIFSRAGVHDLRAYYVARLDGWQFGLRAWKGLVLSQPVGFSITPRFGPVARGTSISQRVLAYADNDSTLVIMPQTTLSADVADRFTLGASYMADVVSSASVDIVATATKRLEERRDQVGIGTSYAEDEARGSASLTYSREPDFESTVLLLGASRDFLERNFTVSTEYQLRVDHLGVSGDDPLPHRAVGHRGRLEMLQLIDTSSFFQVGFSASYESGYLTNPYRFVRVAGVRLAEDLPDVLQRYAGAVRYARLLAPGHGARVEYRFYFDSWGVQSHTAELRYNVRIDPFTFRLHYRFYRQGGARFYRGEYTEQQSHFTGDRELGPFTGHGTGLEGAWSTELRGLLTRIGAEAGVELLRYSYDDFPLQPTRTAIVGQAALNLGF